MNELSGHIFTIHRDGAAELICPKPRRVTFAEQLLKPAQKLQSQNCLPVEGDAGCEIIDILLCKSGLDDLGGTSCPMSHLVGSPPSRSSNPIIRDVQFNQKINFSPPIILEQSSPHNFVGVHPLFKKSSCSSSCGGDPSVRVEGFALSGSDSHRGVPTLA